MGTASEAEVEGEEELERRKRKEKEKRGRRENARDPIAEAENAGFFPLVTWHHQSSPFRFDRTALMGRHKGRYLPRGFGEGVGE
ncbi:hypothetical protein Droror1_Dr00022447 [Drosera rotundifolia]